MNDFLVVAVAVILSGLLLYWFWPGTAKCGKCSAALGSDGYGYCTNLACYYSARQQP